MRAFIKNNNLDFFSGRVSRTRSVLCSCPQDQIRKMARGWIVWTLLVKTVFLHFHDRSEAPFRNIKLRWDRPNSSVMNSNFVPPYNVTYERLPKIRKAAHGENKNIFLRFRTPRKVKKYIKKKRKTRNGHRRVNRDRPNGGRRGRRGRGRRPKGGSRGR
jgi:IS1 family transposase